MGGLLVVGLALLLLVAGTNVALVARLDRIEGAFDALDERPPASAGETILMLGTRPDDDGDVPWLGGTQSVESVMLVEIDQGGEDVQVVSLPVLDDVVASTRPAHAVAAVESSTGRRVDHLLALDWRTFARLAADNGVDAAYEFGSGTAVQHDYLTQVVEGTLHAELRRQPVALFRSLRTVADGASIDDDWSILELDLLVLRLRDLRSQDITFTSSRRR